jgi:hypothetical protein
MNLSFRMEVILHIMKPIMSMMFQSPGLLSILSHRQIYPLAQHREPIVSTRVKNPKGLYVRVDIPHEEVSNLYNKAIEMAIKEAANKRFDYYKAYLRQLIPNEEDRYDKIIATLKPLRCQVADRMAKPYTNEVLLVDRLIRENKYVSKNTKRPGLIVKMFHTDYYGQDVFVKVYLYDPYCQSYRSSFTENFKNEVIFQSYAKQLNETVDFISPEVYSWGRIRNYVLDNTDYEFECLFMIMEYIPFVTLKEAVYTTEHMRHIYERVEQIDTELSSHLLHHNDLHSGNIMVSDRSPLDKSPLTVGDKSPLSAVGDKSHLSAVGDKSPYPEIVILDFGEASLGPTKPIFQSLHI